MMYIVTDTYFHLRAISLEIEIEFTIHLLLNGIDKATILEEIKKLNQVKR